MRFFVLSSIRLKLYAVVLAAVTSAVVIASVAFAWQQASGHFEVRQREMQGIALALASSAAMPLANKDHRALARTLGAIRGIPGITYITVLDPNGQRIFQHGIGVVLDRGDNHRTANEKLTPLTALYLGTTVTRTPIVFAGRPIGILILIADLKDLRATLLNSILISLLIGLLASGIGIAVTSVLHRSITAPIRSLTRTMQAVRDTHDFSQTATRSSTDETGLLVDAFNDMLRHIRERDTALRKHQDTLEDTVRARTRDLRSAMTAAEKANAAKSEFLATMSHEIRTPMNGMLVMAELLSASGLAPRLQRYSDIVVSSGRSLLTIINDILDFSKIEAGKLELESVPLAPRQLVDDVTRLFSERASSKSLDLCAYVAPGVPEKIAADPVRLNQIITNLVNNALKFTSQGGVTIRIEMIPQPDRTSNASNTGSELMRLSVIDTGIGVPAEKLSTIFDAFSQADQSTTRNYGGSGIGLSICQRLVAAMSGEIRVESTVGMGSTFSCLIPVTVLEAANPIPPLETKCQPTAIVTLAPGLIKTLLEETLRNHHFTVCNSENAESWGDATLVFCDAIWLQSPEYDALKPHIRPGLPVIALTPFGDSRGDQLLANGRATRLLELPIPAQDLDSILRLTHSGGDLKAFLAQHHNTRNVSSAHRSFRGTRVLAADDSAVNREVLAEVLRRLDVDFTQVNDGTTAVAAAKSGEFDLILMDGTMPGMDGFDACRAIREWEAGNNRSRVPVIALTAHVVGELGTRWRDCGMDDFIAKPFTLASIEACFAKHIANGVAPPQPADVTANTQPLDKNVPDYPDVSAVVGPIAMIVLRG